MLIGIKYRVVGKDKIQFITDSSFEAIRGKRLDHWIRPIDRDTIIKWGSYRYPEAYYADYDKTYVVCLPGTDKPLDGTIVNLRGFASIDDFHSIMELIGIKRFGANKITLNTRKMY